jgi:hypothetical protein
MLGVRIERRCVDKREASHTRRPVRILEALTSPDDTDVCGPERGAFTTDVKMNSPFHDHVVLVGSDHARGWRTPGGTSIVATDEDSARVAVWSEIASPYHSNGVISLASRNMGSAPEESSRVRPSRIGCRIGDHSPRPR